MSARLNPSTKHILRGLSRFAPQPPLCEYLGRLTPCKQIVRDARIPSTLRSPQGITGPMSLLGASQWLADTQWSIALHESLYGYPIVESIHVWALCLFVGLTVDPRSPPDRAHVQDCSGLRSRQAHPAVAGAGLRDHGGERRAAVLRDPGALVSEHLLPREARAARASPGSTSGTSTATSIGGFRTWDRDPRPPAHARFAGFASLALWVVIIFCGRMIAYNWYDCDKQPQPGVVNVLAGCTPAQIRGQE